MGTLGAFDGIPEPPMPEPPQAEFVSYPSVESGDEQAPCAAIPTAAAVWLVLMKAHRSLAALMEQSIASLGIGLSDFILLEALLHKGAMNISQLGEKVQLANSSMTAAVDRLVQRGLVQRQSDEADRRVRTVDLTPCGRALIQKLFTRHELDIDVLMQPLCPAERTALRASLKKIGLAAQAQLDRTL